MLKQVQHDRKPSINSAGAKRLLLLLTFTLVLLPEAAHAQHQLFAGLMRTKGYVVGAPLASSGLFRFAGPDTSWTHIGWNHPRISAVAFDPADPNTFYLAAGSGVLRTMDGGKSWRLVTGWDITEVQDVAVDPNAPERVYAAAAYGIWRSRDRGQTWTPPDESWLPNRKYTQTLAVDRTKAGRILAGTWDGLTLSEDAGETWMPIGPRGLPVLDVEQSLTDADVWLAGTQERGVLRSEDGGRTWQAARGEIADEVVYSVSIDPRSAKKLAAAGWGGAYVSTNGGKSWTQRSRGLPTVNLYQIVFDPDRQDRLWAATVERGIYRSDDLGRSWHYAGMDGTLIFDLVFVDRRQQ